MIDLDEVKLLVETCGVDVNAKDYDSGTAAHLAAGNNEIAVLSYLLKNGADPNAIDRWGCRPLDEAHRIKSDDIRVLLLKCNAVRGSIHPTSHVDSKSNSVEQDPDFAVEFSELEILDKIGDGAFGAIYKCKWRWVFIPNLSIYEPVYFLLQMLNFLIFHSDHQGDTCSCKMYQKRENCR